MHDQSQSQVTLKITPTKPTRGDFWLLYTPTQRLDSTLYKLSRQALLHKTHLLLYMRLPHLLPKSRIAYIGTSNNMLKLNVWILVVFTHQVQSTPKATIAMHRTGYIVNYSFSGTKRINHKLAHTHITHGRKHMHTHNWRPAAPEWELLSSFHSI